MKTEDAYYDDISTPLGGLTLVVDGGGCLLAVAFLNEDRKRDACQSWPRTREALERSGFQPRRDTAKTAGARRQFAEYFAGRRRDFDLEVEPRGTDFQRRVWELLREIPPGETRTYSELAAAVGRPKAARAVGRAVATNPISVVIPCHRVVGADGSLTGFAGGLRFKEGLLELESTT